MDNNNQNTNPYGSSDPMSGQNSYGNTNPADNNMYQNPTDTTSTYNNPANNSQQGNLYSAPENNTSAGNTYNSYNNPVNNTNQPYQNTSGSYNYSGSDYYNQPEQPQSSSNGFAVASMILGILAIPLGCCYGIGIVFAIISIVMAFIGKKNNGGSFGGMGLAGIICSCIGILMGVLFWVFLLIGLSQMSSSELDSILNSVNFIL